MHLGGTLLILFSLTFYGYSMKNDAEQEKIMVDFSAPTDSEWIIVNDGVMGGLSRSNFKLLDDSTAFFSGTVSLENYGGFASVRSNPYPFKLKDFVGIKIRIKGDGKRYSFRIRTDSDFDGIAYKSDFLTEKDQWTEIKLPFSSFLPTFRGRILKNVPPLQQEKIRQIGFMISEKQEGSFSLYIDWIKAYR